MNAFSTPFEQYFHGWTHAKHLGVKLCIWVLSAEKVMLIRYVKLWVCHKVHWSEHFYLRPVLAFRYCHCLSMCVCVCLLDQGCKTTWLRSLLFWGGNPLSTSWSRLFNSSPRSATCMRQWIGSALVQIMACHLFSAKPSSKPMLGYCQLDP